MTWSLIIPTLVGVFFVGALLGAIVDWWLNYRGKPDSLLCTERGDYWVGAESRWTGDELFIHSCGWRLCKPGGVIVNADGSPSSFRWRPFADDRRTKAYYARPAGGQPKP